MNKPLFLVGVSLFALGVFMLWGVSQQLNRKVFSYEVNSHSTP